MKIDHFSHEHPLRPVVAALYDHAVCSVCRRNKYRLEMYECKSCDYRLDKRCLGMPHKILSSYHPHPLYVQVNDEAIRSLFYGGKRCHACDKPLKPGFYYACLLCYMNLHASCAHYKPTREDLYHFSHFHPLTLHEIEFDDEIEPEEISGLGFNEIELDRLQCNLCRMRNVGRIPVYVCSNCKVYSHQQCCMLKLPREIQHPSHQCFLTLDLRIRSYVDPRPLNYSCENCKFTVKFDQALDNMGYKAEKQFYHFSHRHPLELIEQINEDGQINCLACGKFCSSPTYGCITCQYFLHQTCIDLPLEIQHFFHPCTLFLSIQPKSFSCGACERTIQGFYFHCQQCNFSMDIECSLLPTRQSPNDEEQFFHISHGHPLTLSDIKEDQQFYCSVCRRCSTGPAFVCGRCSFFLEKTCFDHLQPEIEYPFHPRHPLFLQGEPTKVKSVCNVCCKNLSGPTYRCLLCKFEMHIQCTLQMPAVSYEGHNHILFFLENIETQVKCNSCDTSRDSCVFHCVKCDFNLHLLCGPLPCIIKPECHYHPFILKDSPLEDESDEFYCDICEKERDPRLSVYNCKQCLFPAEAKCVVSEIVLTLKGNYGDVDLRTLVGQFNGKLNCKSVEVQPKEQRNSNNEAGEMKIKPFLTSDAMLASFNEHENKELNDVLVASRRDVAVVVETASDDRSQDSEFSLFSCSDLVTAFSVCKNMETNGDLAARRSGLKVTGVSTGQRDSSDGDLKISLFSDSIYKHFMEKLDSSTHYSPLTLWEGNEEVVNFRDSWIPHKLVPVLKKLCAKHKNFGAESTLSPRVKNYFTVMLCGTIHSMCNTRIIDISENLLLNWWNNLRTLEFAGFKVQFAFDDLEKVVRAYFGLQVDKAEAKLDGEMSKLSKVIEQLSIELKELKETRELIVLAKASKCNIIKDCLTESSTKKWSPAATCLD